MICSHCRDVVLDLARGVAHVEEAAALNHVRECPACNRYFQQQRDLTAGLRAMGARTDAVPSDALEQRLLAAVEARSLTGSHSALAQSRASHAGWLKIAAALMLVASAVAAWQWHARVTPAGSTTRAEPHGSVATPVPDAAPPAGGIGPAQALTASQPAVDDARAGRLNAHRVSARPVVRPVRQPVVQAGPFVTLPDASMLPPFERGEIVRVRIQVASLANLGFTVQPDAADTTPINADLLVGQDGQPRAIRLVTNVSQAPSRSMR